MIFCENSTFKWHNGPDTFLVNKHLRNTKEWVSFSLLSLQSTRTVCLRLCQQLEAPACCRSTSLQCFSKDCKTCTGRRVLCVYSALRRKEPWGRQWQGSNQSSVHNLWSLRTAWTCSRLPVTNLKFAKFSPSSIQLSVSIFSFSLYPGPFAFRSI